MPKDSKNNKGPKNTEGEMTVVMFRFKGSNETLQEGFKVFGQALEKIVPTVPVSRSILSKSAKVL